MHPNPKRIIPVILIILLAIFGWWYFRGPRAAAKTGELTASGTIEATQVTISPEFGGKVAEVSIDEGQAVKAGQVLARIEDKLLQAQLDQAKAVLAVAQANYDLIAAGPTPEQRQLSIAAAELEVTQAQQALDDLNATAALVAAQAQQAVAAADKQLDTATERLDNLNTATDQADIDAVRAQVTVAKDRLDKANEKYEPYTNKPEDNLTRAALLARQADAQKKYDNLVTRLNNLLGDANQYDLALAETGKLLAQQLLKEAQRQADKIKDGPNPDTLKLAEDRLSTAQAKLAAAKAETSPEQLAVAKAQVGSALAALNVIQAQMDKLVIYAPGSGVVLKRFVEPGEVTTPGGTLLTLASLADLTITVYVPEDRYGAIAMGQEATLTTDSFPGQTFKATVVNIADKAEFTPRNVQTAEGRRTTVFAVKLAVNNPDGQLKAGMPADVKFR